MATDERFDELISTWLQETAPAQIPARVLEEAAQRTRASRQHVGWRGLLRSIHVTRSLLALGATAAIVVVAVLALSPRVAQPDVATLPTTPDAWSRVSIDSPWATAQVDVLVAGPRGLLAFMGETGSSQMQLSVSTDGQTWTLVPNDQFPSDAVLLPPGGSLGLPAVGTTQGFLFVADGNEVWASEDGNTWQRLTDRARDEDLRAGRVLAVAVGGPGLVAVGSDNKAWFSEDGSDWTQADVPAPPTASFEAQGLPPPTVFMQGVAVRGDTFVAWGTARSGPNYDEGTQETVLWTSGDGRSWANVPDQEDIEPLRTVAAGPGGFVATDMNVIGEARAVRFSADGRSWETVDAFASRLPSYDAGLVASVAATSSGYVAVGGEGVCDMEPCPDARAVIWTSPDGRSWSQLQRDDRFEVADPRTAASHSGAWATSAVAWDSRFVVAGAYDASPVVWISGTPGAIETSIASPTTSSHPRNPFLGVWISTSDADGGTQTMTVEPSANDSVEVVVTDTIASVCDLTPSTMTGTGSIDGNNLVIPTPDYRCDDGSEPQTMDGPPLNEQLRNLTYTRDASTDTLSVGIGDVWLREGAEAPSPAPQPSEQAAPPSESEVTALLNDFLDARIAGEGAEEYLFFEGEVTLHAAHPWDHVGSVSARLTPDGPGVRSNGEDIGTWDVLVLMADPAPLTGCQSGPVPADAEALAESIQSDSDLEWTAPVAVSAGGTEALMMDVAFADYTDAGTCDVDGVAVADVPGAVVVKDIGLTMGDWGPMDTWLSYVPEPDDPSSISAAEGTPIRMRLYLFDAPEGSSMRTLAIAIAAPESSFERAVEAAAPVVDSIEFDAP